jgi:glucose/mannose transport system permease protein
MTYTQRDLFLFLTPLLAIVTLMYGMMAWTVYVSMNDWVGMAPHWDFSGLKNYITLFRMERFWVNLKNNLIWLGVFIVPTALLGLLLAYALDLSGRAEKLFRPLFLYPLALSFVVTGTLWV